MSLLERFKKSETDDLKKRVPPGQHLTSGFPVLTYGQTPIIDRENWKLSITGLVEKEVSFDWAEIMALPQSEVHCDIHCVTTWSKLDTDWAGIKFNELVKHLGVKPEARFVVQHCFGGYTTSLPLATMMDDDVLLAHTFDGEPIEADHGGPLRVVVPKLYFWKSAKWINGLEFLAEDSLGFWEVNGYHNDADPWKEERYAPPGQYRKFEAEENKAIL